MNNRNIQRRGQRAPGKVCSTMYEIYYSRLIPHFVWAASRKTGWGSGDCARAKRCAQLKMGETLFQKGLELVCG